MHREKDKPIKREPLLIPQAKLGDWRVAAPPNKKPIYITFEQLPLARSVLRLISMHPKHVRKDAPTSEWYEYLHNATHQVWARYEKPSMDDVFGWSKIEIFRMVQTMRKSPYGGTARVAYVSIMKGHTSCARGGCLRNTGEVHTDHIIPTKEGGIDDLSNWQLACDFCNQSKGNRRDFQRGDADKLWGRTT